MALIVTPPNGDAKPVTIPVPIDADTGDVLDLVVRMFPDGGVCLLHDIPAYEAPSREPVCRFCGRRFDTPRQLCGHHGTCKRDAPMIRGGANPTPSAPAVCRDHAKEIPMPAPSIRPVVSPARNGRQNHVNTVDSSYRCADCAQSFATRGALRGHNCVPPVQHASWSTKPPAPDDRMPPKDRAARVLRCSTCGWCTGVDAPASAVSLHRHMVGAHRRAPTAGERTPVIP